MSIEYTIDIQLSELGFPDVLQTPEASSTSSDDSFPPINSSFSSKRQQRLLVRRRQNKTEQTTEVSVSPPSDTSPFKPLKPKQSQHDEQAVKGTGLIELSELKTKETTEPSQLKNNENNNRETDADDGDTVQEDSVEARQDVEDDNSDDSEVSVVCEEEEVDEEEEDEEEEEGLNNESSHSGSYSCSVCDLQLPSKFKLQDHMNLHTGARPYCCAECGKRFCQIYNYRVHLRTHAQTKVDRLKCRICLMGFMSQEDLNVHLSINHSENEFYECDLCKRVFTSLKACEYHVQLHNGTLNVACDTCGRNFSSSKSLARHQRRRCHRNFKCTDCSKVFTKKTALLKHSFSHLGLLPYTCIRCHCHFRLAKLYLQHKCEPERIHCVACLREFLSQEDFQQHKKDTGCWGNQEPKLDEIRCLECGQRFDTTEELKKHAGAHQRVLKCADCGKGFRSALLLMSHMGGHAGKSPCLCQSCGLGFPHQQNYDSHLKTCGQTPTSAPRKRQAPKSSTPETKKLDTKPDSSNRPNMGKTPAAVSEKPAAPVTESHSPGPVTTGVSHGTSQSDGLWKLTLNKQPPPGVKLVLFLPVCPTQTRGLTLPSAVSPPMTLPPISSEHFRVSAALAAPLNAPLDLVTKIKQDPESEAPLDLSKKCKSFKTSPSHSPLLPIKSEPDEYEISKASSSNLQTVNGISKPIKTISADTDTHTEVKQLNMEPMDLSFCPVETSCSELKTEIKKEPQSPSPGF